MFIKDIHQQFIEVTDLNKAIDQAKMFASKHHCDKRFKELDKRLQRYWKDILQKLVVLKGHD
jgi:hypothetical protein